MKTTLRGQKISGYYGPDMGRGHWLFVRAPKSGRTYSIARVVEGEIVELHAEPALRDFTNRELAEALIAAS